MDSDQRHRYGKSLLVDLAPSDGEFEINEHHGDALSLVEESGENIALTPCIINPKQFDLESVQRWLTLCKHSHGIACTPNFNP